MNVVVIGAGVFGAWSAWFLSQSGHQVTVIDAYGPANSRSSSADHSRVTRCGYGANAIYSQWAQASLDDWRWLSRETGRDLVTTSGALFMGAPADPYVRATHTTLSSLHIPTELLDIDSVHARFPQISVARLGESVFEPRAGVIRARAGVQALVALMVARGKVVYRPARVAGADESRPQIAVQLTGGEPIKADAFVFACGPWLATLFPLAIGARMRPTRQEVLHFGVPAGDNRFAIPQLPVWIDFQAGVYGIPDLDARGFKVGIDRHGPPIDPDEEERLVAPELVDRTRTWLGLRFPGLRGAPLVEGRVCQYENTSTGDFIIDRHPNWPNVWIVGGGSGHGFKHGPSVGRHLAALVNGEADVEPRFALAGKTTVAARSVF